MPTRPPTSLAALDRRLGLCPVPSCADRLRRLARRRALELHADGRLAVWSTRIPPTPRGERVRPSAPQILWHEPGGPGTHAAVWLAVDPADVLSVAGGDESDPAVQLVVTGWQCVLQVPAETPAGRRPITRIGELVQPQPAWVGVPGTG